MDQCFTITRLYYATTPTIDKLHAQNRKKQHGHGRTMSYGPGFGSDSMILQVNTPADALKWLSTAGSFLVFKQRVLQCMTNIDLSMISVAASKMTIVQVDASMIDWR